MVRCQQRVRVGAAASYTAIRDVVVHPLLGRAELAFGGAWTGEAAFTVALSVVAYREGGPAAVGVLALVRMVPSALLAPVLTALADRMRRERVLVVVSLVRAVAIGAAALLAAVGTAAVGVYALAVVDAVAFTLSTRPARCSVRCWPASSWRPAPRPPCSPTSAAPSLPPGCSCPSSPSSRPGDSAALDERLGVREDEIDVLRSAPMLNLLPVPSIEHLASRLRRRTFRRRPSSSSRATPAGPAT